MSQHAKKGGFPADTVARVRSVIDPSGRSTYTRSSPLFRGRSRRSSPGVKAKGIPYGSGPDIHADGRINTRRGGRGFYFQDPYGHLLEVMTVPETSADAF